MHDAFHPQGRVRFDAFDVDLATGELRKQGRKIRLAGRPFQILAMLLERPGELLTRKELQQRLWPDGTFVDFEHGVNASIQSLRRALCDSYKKPRFIETLPRRGYRFIAAVERIDRTTPPREPEHLPAHKPAHEPAHGPAHEIDRREFPVALAPVSPLVGQVATICDALGRESVLLPVSEEIFDEMCGCQAAKDDLGFALLVGAEKLLLVNCGTEVKILEAANPARGCTVRIMAGEFFGDKFFVPRGHLKEVR